MARSAENGRAGRGAYFHNKEHPDISELVLAAQNKKMAQVVVVAGHATKDFTESRNQPVFKLTESGGSKYSTHGFNPL